MPPSTLDAATDAYLANASYDVNGSASECASFIAACRALLLLMPLQSKQGRAGGEQTNNPDLISERLKAAETWYARNRDASSCGGGGGTRFADFSDFRS